MPKLATWGKDLFDWQQACFDRWRASERPDFLVLACPGAGKTTLAHRVGHWSLAGEAAESLIVVVPTDSLRIQWARSAAEVGIQLDPDWTNGATVAGPDYHGIIVTYQSVAALPDLYRRLCATRRTVVTLDEVHHAGDSRAWGEGVRRAFEPAWRRLLLSGTPFRSDGSAIPYVTYVDDRCRPDYTFGYGDALQAGICRPIMFPHYEGEMRWTGPGGVRTARFADPLPDEEAGRRLRTALDVRGEWLPTIIREADACLTSVRRNVQPDAGGLIVAIDQRHAQAIAELVRRITGEPPVVAISEDPRAADKIREFARGASRWLVCVRLVSEGVDIPRLYCGVFATNILSELYFLQLAGRFVRRTRTPDLDGQVAALYIPAVPELIAYAQGVREVRDAAIRDQLASAREAQAPEGADGSRPPSPFAPLSSRAEAAGVLYEDRAFPPAIMAEAARRCRILGVDDPARLLLAAGLLALAPPEVDAPPASGLGTTPGEAPIYQQRRALRNIRATLVRILSQVLFDVLLAEENAFKIINDRLAAATGTYVTEASVGQLGEQNDLLLRWTDEARAAIAVGTGAGWVAAWRAR